MASSTEITHTPDSMEGVESNATAPVGGALAIDNHNADTVGPARSTKSQQPYVESEGNNSNGNHGSSSPASAKNPQSSLDKARLVESYYILVGLKADAYRLLQLPAYCDNDKAIKTAWYKIIQKLHSDHNEVEDADDYAGVVNAARDKVMDADKRKGYNPEIKEEKKGRFNREDLTGYELLYVPRDATDAEISYAYTMELGYFPEPADAIYRNKLEREYNRLKDGTSRAVYNKEYGIVPTERATFSENAAGDGDDLSDSESEAEPAAPPPPSTTVRRLLQANTELVVSSFLGDAAPGDLEAMNKTIHRNNTKHNIALQAYVLDGEHLKTWRKQLKSIEEHAHRGKWQNADILANTFLETTKIEFNDLGWPEAWSAEVARKVLSKVYPRYMLKRHPDNRVDSPPMARDNEGDIGMTDARVSYPDLTQAFGRETGDKMLDQLVHGMGQMQIINNPETNGESLRPGEIPGGHRILGYYPISPYACTFVITSSNPRNPIRSQPGSTLSADIKNAFFGLPEEKKINVKIQVPNARITKVIGHCLSAKAEMSPPITCPSYGFVLCHMENNKTLLLSQRKFLGRNRDPYRMHMIVDFYAANRLPLPWYEASFPPHTTLVSLGKQSLLDQNRVDPTRQPENYRKQALLQNPMQHPLPYEDVLSDDSDDDMLRQHTYPRGVTKPVDTRVHHGLRKSGRRVGLGLDRQEGH